MQLPEVTLLLTFPRNAKHRERCRSQGILSEYLPPRGNNCQPRPSPGRGLQVHRSGALYLPGFLSARRWPVSESTSELLVRCVCVYLIYVSYPRKNLVDLVYVACEPTFHHLHSLSFRVCQRGLCPDFECSIS